MEKSEVDCTNGCTFFRYFGLGSQVYLAGSWDKWELHEMVEINEKNFFFEINLKPGMYQFKFKVNDDWTCANYRYRVKENGIENNVFQSFCYYDKETLSFHLNEVGKNVSLLGSWNNWREIPMNIEKLQHSYSLKVPPGKIEFRFKVDGQWYEGPNDQRIGNLYGSFNYVFHCIPNPLFKKICILPSAEIHNRNITPYIKFLNEDFVILHSIIESETQFHPEINFEPFLTYIDLENFEILRLKEFIEIETICLVIKNFKKKIHNESHSLLLDTVEDNLFSCDYYDSTIKKVKNYKTTQIISKFDEKTTFDEFYDSLKINRVDIENYESKNEKEIYELQYSILTQNMIGFVLFRLLLIKNTINKKREFSSFIKSSAKNFLIKYFEYFKRFLLNKQENTNIFDFQQSLLLIVSRACCENCLEKKLFEQAQQMLTSFDTVQITKIDDQTDEIIYEGVLNFFHKIVKTRKFCEALKKLIKTIEVKLNNEKIIERINEAILLLSKIQPILVKNVTINGMVSTKNNFFIKVNFIGDLSNIKNNKNFGIFQKLHVAKGSLLRLFIHESAHLVIRFCQSEKNTFDYLFSTPPNNFKNEYSEYLNLECGSRLEAILFGSCERIFYGLEEFNKKVFDQTIWDNEILPIFSKEEENQMDLIKKNVYFSGIDEFQLNNYE